MVCGAVNEWELDIPEAIKIPQVVIIALGARARPYTKSITRSAYMTMAMPPAQRASGNCV